MDLAARLSLSDSNASVKKVRLRFLIKTTFPMVSLKIRCSFKNLSIERRGVIVKSLMAKYSKEQQIYGLTQMEEKKLVKKRLNAILNDSY